MIYVPVVQGKNIKSAAALRNKKMRNVFTKGLKL